MVLWIDSFPLTFVCYYGDSFCTPVPVICNHSCSLQMPLIWMRLSSTFKSFLEELLYELCLCYNQVICILRTRCTKNLHPLSAYVVIQHSTWEVQSIATLRSALESLLNGWQKYQFFTGISGIDLTEHTCTEEKKKSKTVGTWSYRREPSAQMTAEKYFSFNRDWQLLQILAKFGRLRWLWPSSPLIS